MIYNVDKNKPTETALNHIANLDKIKEILNSDQNNREKAYKIYNFYNGSKKFKSAFLFLEKSYKKYEDYAYLIPDVKKIEGIIAELEDKGYFDEAIFKSKHKKSFEELNDAIEVITSFTKSNATTVYDFINERKEKETNKLFNEEIFKRYVNIIDILDHCDFSVFHVNLYRKYEKKRLENTKANYLKDKISCEKIVEAIKNNCVFANGEKLNLITFLQYAPFTHIERSKEICKNYTELGKETGNESLNFSSTANSLTRKIEVFSKAVLSADDSKILLDYLLMLIRENNLDYTMFVTRESLKIMYEEYNYVTKGVRLTSEVIDGILDFMEDKEIPYHVKVFKLLLDEYVSNPTNNRFISYISERKDIKTLTNSDVIGHSVTTPHIRIKRKGCHIYE